MTEFIKLANAIKIYAENRKHANLRRRKPIKKPDTKNQ